MTTRQATAKVPPRASTTPAPTKPTSSSKAAIAKPSAPKVVARAPIKAAAAATVTLKQLAAEIAEHKQIAKREADTLLTSLVGILVQHLKEGDRLRIGGLGILEVKDRPERIGRNPGTGEAMTIKASRKIAFRPAKELKEAI
jgi:DNA-binding protein HU-beta